MSQHASHLTQQCALKKFAFFAWVTVCLATNAQATDWNYPSQLSYQIGMDSWNVSTPARQDTSPGVIMEKSNLMLPDTNNKWNYKDVSTYAWLTGSKQLTPSTTTRIKAQANQTLGLRVDEAQIQTSVSPYLGFRLGVVDYKTSWCRNYEPNNLWMREPEPICNSLAYRDVTGGAPGVQLFAQNTWRDYLVQAQFGIYRPKALNYAPDEFGYFSPSREFGVTANKKAGVNISLVHLVTGLEAKFSYIKSFHVGYSPETDLQGTTKLSGDAIYAGLSLPLTPRITAQITYFGQRQDGTCRSQMLTTIDSRCNLNFNFEKRFNTAELTYRINSSNLIGISTNRSNLVFEADMFSANYQVHQPYSAQFAKTTQSSIAWRHELAEKIFTVVQYIRSHQISGNEAPNNQSSDGEALGLKLGYQF
jgi:opacity protein-like surface antigen